jgi:hypothetical protein
MNDDEYILCNAKPTTVWQDLREWYARIRYPRPDFTLELTDDDLP